jgi:hypothetical protein
MPGEPKDKEEQEDETIVTPTGTIIEYRRNAHGGRDVNVRVPMIGGVGTAHPVTEEDKK